VWCRLGYGIKRKCKVSNKNADYMDNGQEEGWGLTGPKGRGMSGVADAVVRRGTGEDAWLSEHGSRGFGGCSYFCYCVSTLSFIAQIRKLKSICTGQLLTSGLVLFILKDVASSAGPNTYLS
jgi:hypothetical protein